MRYEYDHIDKKLETKATKQESKYKETALKQIKDALSGKVFLF